MVNDMGMYIEDETTQGYIKDQIKSHTKSHNDEIKGDLIRRSALMNKIRGIVPGSGT